MRLLSAGSLGGFLFSSAASGVFISSDMTKLFSPTEASQAKSLSLVRPEGIQIGGVNLTANVLTLLMRNRLMLTLAVLSAGVLSVFGLIALAAFR